MSASEFSVLKVNNLRNPRDACVFNLLVSIIFTLLTFRFPVVRYTEIAYDLLII
jgi:hypothetical protein